MVYRKRRRFNRRKRTFRKRRSFSRKSMFRRKRIRGTYRRAPIPTLRKHPRGWKYGSGAVSKRQQTVMVSDMHEDFLTAATVTSAGISLGSYQANECYHTAAPGISTTPALEFSRLEEYWNRYVVLRSTIDVEIKLMDEQIPLPEHQIRFKNWQFCIAPFFSGVPESFKPTAELEKYPNLHPHKMIDFPTDAVPGGRSKWHLSATYDIRDVFNCKNPMEEAHFHRGITEESTSGVPLPYAMGWNVYLRPNQQIVTYDNTPALWITVHLRYKIIAWDPIRTHVGA